MGELSYSAIDRAYPYQVALPEDICCMRNYTLIEEFCQAQLGSRKHAIACFGKLITTIYARGLFTGPRSRRADPSLQPP
jgi:hypothetical protein